MAHFYLLGLSVLVLLITISECTESQEIVSASREEDVVLPCSIPTIMGPESCYRVKWTKHATDRSTQTKVVLARPETSKLQDAERVKLRADGKGDMSLSLTRLGKSDEGLYSCEIWQGWDCILIKNTTLKVKDCRTLQAVKAAPGTPATLQCPINITSAQQPQKVSWAMLKGDSESPIFQYSDISQQRERLEYYGPSLSIPSVELSDSGWYRCKYLLGQSQRCFEIKLQVQVGDAIVVTADPVTATEVVQGLTTDNVLETKQRGSSGASTGVVALVITGVAIVAALIVGVVIYCRRNTQRPEAPRAQRHPGSLMELNDDSYESVHFPALEELTEPRVNSLYRHFQEEGMCTFQRQ
ncbi:cell adhesion molecule Dscam2-like isoform X2 [Centroberyx affinis]|uniref:cell adhesion molecule Dscam2-like isoform X2 n=1 Tax=Centroberyx affinis TaxID=166261 RepID=UPI003A5BD06E